MGEYEDRLAEALMTSAPIEGGWQPAGVYPCFVGLHHPEDGGRGVTYLATPGWEGSALPIEAHSPDGDVEWSASPEVVWHGDIEKDIKLWGRLVAEAIAQHQRDEESEDGGWSEG